MTTVITCTTCQTEINVEQLLAEKITNQLRAQLQDEQKRRDDVHADREQKLNERIREYARQQKDLEKEVNERVKAKENDLRTRLRQQLEAEQAQTVKGLQDEVQRKSGQIKDLQKKELSLLKLETELAEKQAGIELQVAKKVAEERTAIEARARQAEQESQLFKLREKDELLDSMKKKFEDMQRRMEQGSMQTQGEVMETAIEELLTAHFPHDDVEPVAKGLNGADVILSVNTRMGRSCGRIVFESKRTKAFNYAWLTKLLDDQQRHGGEVAVLVTEVMPKELTQFGPLQGVWVCSYREVAALTAVLRESLFRMADVRSAHENRGEKMQLVYDYLISSQFQQQISATVRTYTEMQQQLEKEKRQAIKAFKIREKQLETVVMNTVQVFGAFKGIVGKELVDFDEPELAPADEMLMLDETESQTA